MADVLKKVPVREQDRRFVLQILKKYVTDKSKTNASRLSTESQLRLTNNIPAFGSKRRLSEAVFIGSGAGLPRFMGIPGEQANGVFSANEFQKKRKFMNLVFILQEITS